MRFERWVWMMKVSFVGPDVWEMGLVRVCVCVRRDQGRGSAHDARLDRFHRRRPGQQGSGGGAAEARAKLGREDALHRPRPTQHGPPELFDFWGEPTGRPSERPRETRRQKNDFSTGETRAFFFGEKEGARAGVGLLERACSVRAPDPAETLALFLGARACAR